MAMARVHPPPFSQNSLGEDGKPTSAWRDWYTALHAAFNGVLSAAFGGTGTSATPTAGGAAYGTGSQILVTPAGTAGQVLVSAGAAAPSFQTIAIETRTTAQFDKGANTALSNVTGLTATLLAGHAYRFRAVLHINASLVGGSKYALGGTCTATAFVAELTLLNNASSGYTITSRQTALGGSAGQAGTLAGVAILEGEITVNAAGTLTVQFAQNAAAGTSSVLVGSTFTVTPIA